MNLNLISSKENGYDYLVRFREDIVIPKNSKTYLNFAQLSKLSGVNFTEDQAISVNSSDIYPRYNPNGAFAENSIPLTSATIKKGTYSFTQFQENVPDALAVIKTNLKQLHYYSTTLPIFNPFEANQVLMGYFLQDDTNFKTSDLVIDGTDVADFGLVGENKFCKTSATAGTPLYDAYCGSSIHYYHLVYPCVEERHNNNFCYFESSANVDDLTNGIGFGLYSPEFSSKHGGGASFINGANLPLIPTTEANVSNRRPKAHIFVEIKKVAGIPRLKVYEARVSTGGGGNRLRSMDFNTDFAGLNRVANLNLTTLMTDTNSHIKIQLLMMILKMIFIKYIIDYFCINQQ